MKRYLILLFNFLFIIQFVFPQAPLTKQWDYRFGGTDGDGFKSFVQATDGGFILGGQSASGISGDKTQPIWGGAGDYDY